LPPLKRLTKGVPQGEAPTAGGGSIGDGVDGSLAAPVTLEGDKKSMVASVCPGFLFSLSLSLFPLVSKLFGVATVQGFFCLNQAKYR